uniref:Uncharacterized protein n=1 Tax=Siphoviridae sp. ctWsj12 TaxID=2826363 RepID=A0A8S5NSC8_9CAUD|nr:MAG TPA: hypothetical protein [Siphoviridae sp. ctWsj12]
MLFLVYNISSFYCCKKLFLLNKYDRRILSEKLCVSF